MSRFVRPNQAAVSQRPLVCVCLGSPAIRIIAVAALLLGSLLACTGTTVNLPAVSPENGERHPGKFIWHDLISDSPEASRAFYSELLGWSFRRLKLANANYWIISLNGQALGGMVDQASLATRRDVSQWVSQLSVENAQQSRNQIMDLGGSVLREPVSLGQRGTVAVYADPQGAIFAALQTPSGDPADSPGLPAEGRFFWHELWTSDVPGAAQFYASVNKLSIEQRDLGKGDADQPAGAAVAYSVLRGKGRLRAGIRNLPSADMPRLWMPYLRMSSEVRLREILGRVEGLGGRILVPATARPAGGMVAIIAGPSGAPVALQSWNEEQQTRLEG